MAITKHTLFLNLSHLSDDKIQKMDNALHTLETFPKFGILWFSGLQQAQQTEELKLGFNRGYTHRFDMYFLTEIHRDNYLPDENHQVVVQQLIDLGLNVETICSMDVDALLSSTDAKQLIENFIKKHQCSLERLATLLETSNTNIEANKDLATTATKYLSQNLNEEVRGFWELIDSNIKL